MTWHVQMAMGSHRQREMPIYRKKALGEGPSLGPPSRGLTSTALPQFLPPGGGFFVVHPLNCPPYLAREASFLKEEGSPVNCFPKIIETDVGTQSGGST